MENPAGEITNYALIILAISVLSNVFSFMCVFIIVYPYPRLPSSIIAFLSMICCAALFANNFRVMHFYHDPIFESQLSGDWSMSELLLALQWIPMLFLWYLLGAMLTIQMFLCPLCGLAGVLSLYESTIRGNHDFRQTRVFSIVAPVVEGYFETKPKPE